MCELADVRMCGLGESFQGGEGFHAKTQRFRKGAKSFFIVEKICCWIHHPQNHHSENAFYSFGNQFKILTR
jgi:hypothetical protein